MAKNRRSRIAVSELGEVITQDLKIYANEVREAVDLAGETAIKDLVKKTKATAPKGNRGSFKRNITYTVKKSRWGNQHVWHVKAPDYRLTHLIVHGHATRNGMRTIPNAFLAEALAEVLPEYEKSVKEAIQNGN